MTYKCINSFTNNIGRNFYYGEKINSTEYYMMPDSDRDNFSQDEADSGSLSSCPTSSNEDSTDDDLPLSQGFDFSMGSGNDSDSGSSNTYFGGFDGGDGGGGGASGDW